MIKVFKVNCINDLSYEKTDYINGKTYFAYMKDSSIVVINENDRKSFCDMETCMYRHGHPYGFQKYFEVMDTFFVENKKELKAFIHNSTMD